MGLYTRYVFPLLCDWALDTAAVADLRRELLAAARGQVLEIGMGTGLNLPHYPEQIQRIAAVDPNPGMHRRARRRMQQSGRHVDLRPISGERLPFDDASLDCVVSTFTLCSIADVDAAVSEIHRVIKPAGVFLFLEHGLSPDPAVRRWQRRLNGLQRLIGDNCHLDRDIGRIVKRPTWQSVAMSEFYLDEGPKTHSYLYRGIATR